MGREIKRVPLDFDFPLDETWSGYLSPDKFEENPCPDCTHGYTPRGEHLKAIWWGHAFFQPEDNGMPSFPEDHPAILRKAQRNLDSAPDFYGTGPEALVREARRLTRLFNDAWLHHLNQDDVDALIDQGRLVDFTHAFVHGHGWVKKDPPVRPTADQVNEWSIEGMGHDSINCMIVVEARCKREGVEPICPTCKGRASLEKYPGQREEAEAWERTEPPEGDGWQLWQTVTEGGPISPVFATPEELARWMSSPAYTWGASKHQTLSYDQALAFVTGPGWAPSGMATPEHGMETGEQFMGRTELEKTDEESK